MDILLPHLMSKDSIINSEYERFSNKHFTNNDRVEYLFSLLERGSPSSYGEFVQCLEEEKSHPPHNQFLEELPREVYTPWQPLLKLDYPNLNFPRKRKRTRERTEKTVYIKRVRMRQIKPEGDLAGGKYTTLMTEIQEHHYYGKWMEADRRVQECRGESKELYMAAKLRNYSYHVTNSNMLMEDIVCDVKKILKWCSHTSSDNSKFIESKCHWVLAKGCRYSKKMDEAERHVTDAMQLQYNFEPGEDIGCSSYCKASILNATLVKTDSPEQSKKVKKQVKKFYLKAIENVKRSCTCYGLPVCQPVIRLAQMNLRCSPHEAGMCDNKEEIKQAQNLLTRIETDPQLLKPRIACLYYIAKSDLYRNKQEKEEAEKFVRKAENIALKEDFRAEMDTVATRLTALGIEASESSKGYE